MIIFLRSSRQFVYMSFANFISNESRNNERNCMAILSVSSIASALVKLKSMKPSQQSSWAFTQVIFKMGVIIVVKLQIIFYISGHYEKERRRDAA